MQGVRVWSLVKGLRSHMLHSAAKKIFFSFVSLSSFLDHTTIFFLLFFCISIFHETYTPNRHGFWNSKSLVVPVLLERLGVQLFCGFFFGCSLVVLQFGAAEKALEKTCSVSCESVPPRLSSCFKHQTWFPLTVAFVDQQNESNGHLNIF